MLEPGNQKLASGQELEQFQVRGGKEVKAGKRSVLDGYTRAEAGRDCRITVLRDDVEGLRSITRDGADSLVAAHRIE